MATTPLARLLKESEELKPLAERLDRIGCLQKTYRTLAPGELAEASRVSAIDGTVVVISATTGPVAAALKQLAPRLLRGLRASERGARDNSLKQNEIQPEITGIRVEVQVTAPIRVRKPSPRGELPRDKLSAVAKALEDSPLKDTLERIARPQNRRTREKT